MSHPEIPAKHKKKVLDLIESLVGKHGFKMSEFSRPIPSDQETPFIGWWIKLLNFPDYHFFFRETNEGLFIKYLPNPDEAKEKTLKIVLRQGDSFLHLQKTAERWLKTIEDGIKENERMNSFFNHSNEHEYTSYEEMKVGELEIEDDKITLTQEEITNVRQFLIEFNSLVQKSETLDEETKTQVSNIKEQAEIKLETQPTRKLYRWLGKVLNEVIVKLITDKAYRNEIIGYIKNAYKNIKPFINLFLENNKDN
jgi:hypothetical protein